MPLLKLSKYVVFLVSLGLISWQLLTPAPEVQVGGNDKIVHAAAFAWLSLSAHWAFYKQFKYWTLIAIVLCAYGLATEVIQYFVPGRAFSLLDWLADCMGVLVAYPVFSVVLAFFGLKVKLN